MGFNCFKARTTSRRQFTFYHSVPRSCSYSFHWPRKDETLSRPCWVVLNTGTLDWESSVLTTSSYKGKYGYDFNTDGKTEIILLKVKRRNALRLSLSSLKLCRILKAVSKRWQHKLGPKQSLAIFFQKKLLLRKKLCTLNLINMLHYLNRIYLFIWLEIIAKRFNQICYGQN